MSHQQRWSTAIAVLVFASPLAAQNVPSLTAAPEPVAVVTAPVAAPTTSLAPVAAASSIGVHALAPALAAPAPRRETPGRNPAMMIVGGVALLVGAVVGGDSGTIIMVAGGALGLYGLWQYLK
jgi:hypothetical protein